MTELTQLEDRRIELLAGAKRAHEIVQAALRAMDRNDYETAEGLRQLAADVLRDLHVEEGS